MLGFCNLNWLVTAPRVTDNFMLFVSFVVRAFFRINANSIVRKLAKRQPSGSPPTNPLQPVAGPP